ncbi:MAG: hypothetical protein EA342_10680 [Leptolyngbya sp. LCM1.Bin17]|nr:MAG: hypothetical protein EA342_10680 [Leptolyngbya sp. LCM1.Bin17]
MTDQLTVNLSQGSIRFAFTPEAAKALKVSLEELMAELKVASAPAQGGARPTPKAAMEYRHTGEVFLEVFCNPNIWSSPFAAQALITLRDDRMRITTEVGLPQLYDDIKLYLEQV